MAVVVAENDTNLSTVNGFYRAEAYNLGVLNNVGLALSSIRRWYVTFANAVNLRGVVIKLGSVYNTAVVQKDVTVDLAQIRSTVTMTIASPCVVTYAGHGFLGGEKVFFATSGALPTGLTAETSYYVKYIDANTFNLAATPGGANINTSGTQSGIHTLFSARLSKTITASSIRSGTTTDAGDWLVPFIFPSTYAVDTTASKWIIRVEQGTGGTTNWILGTSDASNASYVAWGDVAVSFTSGSDAIIQIGKITIDQTATLKGYLGTGDTTTAVCGWLCRSTDPTIANVCGLRWASSPASSYTFTLDGQIICSNLSGMQIGTEASPIPAAQQARVIFKTTPSVGTLPSGFADSTRGNNSILGSGKISFMFYGQIPSVDRYATLATDANVGDTTLTLNESPAWNIGDTLRIGKQEASGYTAQTYTIQSIAGNVITLTGGIATTKRKAGGTVLNESLVYGVYCGSDSTTMCGNYTHHFSNFYMSGVMFYNTAWGCATSSYIGRITTWDSSANKSKWVVQDCAGMGGYVFFQVTAPAEGILVNRFYGTTILSVTSSMGTYYTNQSYVTVGGPFSVTNCRIIQPTIARAVIDFTYTPYSAFLVIQNNSFENCGGSGYPTLYLCGQNLILENNMIYGGLNLYQGLFCTNLFNSSSINNNTLDYQSRAINFTAVTQNVTFKNTSFNPTGTQGTFYDLFFGYGGNGIVDVTFENTTNFQTFYTTSFTDYIALGSRVRFVNYNGTANDDRVYLIPGYLQRTGTGLTDTTTHTTGSYSLRFESKTGNYPVTWSMNNAGGFTIGNCQNKSLTFIIWCKINSLNYFNGTNVAPKIDINYDNGTHRYAYASSTTTNWQRIAVTFTPTTTFGTVYIDISTQTDQTTTNSYVYFADYDLQLPSGVQVNPGSFTLWAKAYPSDGLATNVTEKGVSDAVWDDMLTEHTVSGSFGVAVTFINKVVGWLRSLL